MKPQAILIGLAAGLTAALLFAGIVLQSTTALGLSLLAPIPIYIASLGWGSLTGFLAAGSAAVAVFLGTGSLGSAMTMLVSMAAPAAYAGHLAGLSRPLGPVAANGTPTVEWYPLGHILLAIALCTMAACLFIGWLVGYDPQEFGPMIAEALMQQSGGDVDPATRVQVEQLSRLLVDLVPLVQPALLVVVLVATLHLAAAITRMSGRLPRPRDDIPATSALPKSALPLFALAIAGSFLPGAAGTCAGVATGALGAAFTLIGLASMHRRTRARSARGLLLFTAYAAMMLLSFPIVAFTMLGVFETTRRPAEPLAPPPPA